MDMKVHITNTMRKVGLDVNTLDGNSKSCTSVNTVRAIVNAPSRFSAPVLATKTTSIGH